MKKKIILPIIAALLMPFMAYSQKVEPTASYLDSKGDAQETKSEVRIDDVQAPLEVTFRANPSEMDDYSPSYEWHFCKTDASVGSVELFVRYEEDTQYTFSESGNYTVVLKTKLDQDGTELDSVSFSVFIADSWLEFPNAFSPNGDGLNDIYKAKEGYKNIVSFKGIIINRWGQKLFEWTNPADGWDGTYKGHNVKEGVYFAIIKAKGSDGKEYDFRKDVNLLRRYTEGGKTSGGTN